MSFSREVRDSWMCRSISPSLAPTFGREKGGGKKEEGRRRKSLRGSRLAMGPEEMGGGLGTRTCSASSSACLCAPEASTCWLACRSVACVWLESRLARRCSCFPSLSKALASYGGAAVQGEEGEQSTSF